MRKRISILALASILCGCGSREVRRPVAAYATCELWPDTVFTCDLRNEPASLTNITFIVGGSGGVTQLQGKIVWGKADQ